MITAETTASINVLMPFPWTDVVRRDHGVGGGPLITAPLTLFGHFVLKIQKILYTKKLIMQVFAIIYKIGARGGT